MENTKICKSCGKDVPMDANFCPVCGQGEFLVPSAAVSQPTATVLTGNGKVGMGILGALLFSLGGAVLYFLIYQLGVIAGICGLVIFLLAHFGYGLFSKSKPNNSTLSIVVSVILMVVVIFAAQYFCAAFEVYKELKDWGVSLMDALKMVPELLADDEVFGAFISDLLFAYVFGFIAAAGNIINIVKSKKAQQTPPQPPVQQ